MRGPVVDIVLLSLLILFFGMQQHKRAQKYYRLWFSGWILILLSYAVWEPPVTAPLLVHAQEVGRFDLVLAGALLFMISFLADREPLWRVVAKGLWVGVPALAAFDALEFMTVPKGVLAVAVVGWQVYGLRAAYVLIPKPWGKARLSIYALCMMFAGVDLWSIWRSDGFGLFDWALAEVVLCAAVLYLSIAGRRSVAAWLGFSGFALWGLFYAIAVTFPNSADISVLNVCWSLPKYLVAFSMILKTFEDETEAKTRLAEGYWRLYEDFRVMFDGHPNPMWVYAQEGGGILSANESAVSRYGYSVDEFLKMKYEDLVVTSHEELLLLEALYQEAKSGFARHQLKDGRKIWANVSHNVIKFRGVDAVFQIARDVTDRVENTQKQMHDANHDVLTGLPNRGLLVDRIQQCLKRCQREDRKATLLMIDVDHFKWINDTYGHQVGDECLKIVAARLASKIRQVDTIARVGGEEFAAIVGGLHIAEDAEKVADSLLRVFQEPLWLGEVELSVTVSIGIAVYPDDANESETLTRLSDEALYAAKRAGRNRAVTAATVVAGREMTEQLELGAA
jgi:diguanylate cyclase (GGDEF)-like protein/PAS domain S-box-containing protein